MGDPPPYPGAPRWVKITGIIAIILVLLVIAALFTGVGGPHSPGRHLPSSSSVPEPGMQQP
ncbi:MAG: hypothetical protein EOR30_11925 [Mesorhizobium sp.]|uniref:hypothetical protein n=1 Tax=Mesorhizobium sp. M5C.F.Cr.IN.023.01.1.1 TaxID=2496768 RepID=UPI000FC9AAD1|nr:hypothetical protein [Mesorhizobium sp. M5C.F.Cr.IN.023.01.1.1]RWF87364.1 MAG: hypothetical protein EOQ36_13110 [Mesorhizobium sp.]RUV68772.1 hypothetical protein EOA78_25660 [Mesorhizobium sp. M5C.F.Cr.IN.023.01.1.1]RWF91712.1 MAG: hypothetical protein EOQ45_24655 [Mesorhizobium sp.]RWI33755.1 MAG: hypothetical protein EOR14_32195 [Mesorhizobium sp.]RWI44772.1 MAG: hypothetical protein EOR15_24310 [Mesorhizobium sp.]